MSLKSMYDTVMGVNKKVELQEAVITAEEGDVETAAINGKMPSVQALEAYTVDQSPKGRELMPRILPNVISNTQSLNEEKSKLRPKPELMARFTVVSKAVEKLPPPSTYESLFTGGDQVPAGKVTEWLAERRVEVAKVQAGDDALRQEYRMLSEQLSRHEAIPKEIQRWVGFLPHRWPQTFPGANYIDIHHMLSRCNVI